MRRNIYVLLTLSLLLLCANRAYPQPPVARGTVPYVVDTLSLASNDAQTEKLTYTRAYDLDCQMQPDPMRLSPWIENSAYISNGITLGRKDSTRILFSKNYLLLLNRKSE